jgi:4-hydroxybenzoate polyprenyltransferase
MWFPALSLGSMPGDLWILALFAFLTTLIREIVKDLEDAAGDRHVGDRTLALVLGIRKTKAILAFLILVCISSLIFVADHGVVDQKWMLAFGILTVLLLVWALIHLIVKAREQTGFHTVSVIMKVVMLTGTVYIVL